MLDCSAITKSYRDGSAHFTAVREVTLSFAAGDTAVVVGPSGSGKTTLLSILGCLLTPTSGSVHIRGEQIDYARKSQLTKVRRRSIGFVFQHSLLLPFLRVEDNLRIIAENSGLPRGEAVARTSQLLDELGLQSCKRAYPSTLSGGEQQRVSVARAVIHSPALILADEPTASLDWTNGERVVKLLLGQAKQSGAVLLTVTHDPRLQPLFDRVITLDAGRVVTS